MKLRHGVLLLFSLPLVVDAQSGCADIDFFQAKQITTLGNSRVTFLARRTGGGGLYSGVSYSTSPPIAALRVIPNMQRQFLGCAQGVPSVGGNPASIEGRPEGAAASNITGIRDVGNGLAAGVWTGFSQTTISVFLLNADYSLRNETRYTIPAGARGIRFADLDRDAIPDLVTVVNITGGAGMISFLKGNGDGTFQQARNAPVAGMFPGSFALSDFNGDGMHDMALVRSNEGMVSIHLGNGDGTFRAGASAAVPGLVSVTAADFNGDGRFDLSAPTFSQGVAILLGNGDGTFRAPVNYPAGRELTYVATGDFNRDGRLDLAVSSAANFLAHILPGNGDGTFRAATSYVLGNDPETLVIADVNADGNPDIVAGEGIAELLVGTEDNGFITVLFGRGDGTFAGAQALEVPSQDATRETSFSLASADFNGDGRMDVAVGKSTGHVGLLLGRAGGGLQAGPVLAPPNARRAVSITAADFNGDGRTDLAYADDAGNRAVVLPGSGNAAFQNPLETAITPTPRHVTAADFNGDGRPDLAVTAADRDGVGNVKILLTAANGAPGAPATITAGDNPDKIAAADLNGDGRADLVVLNRGDLAVQTRPGGISVLAGNGNGTFQPAVNYAAGINPLAVSVADVNGDRRPDIAVSTSTSLGRFAIALLIGNGNGTFRNAVFLTTDFGPGDLAVADFNADGRQDLVISHCCGEVDMTYMLGNGDGTFEPEVHFNGGAEIRSIAAVEIGGDAKPDLFILSGRGNTATVLVNTSPARQFVAVSATSGARGPVAPDSIVAAYGANFTTGTAATQSTDLPLELDGATVTIIEDDGTEHAAPLFFVSPGQVNFLVPALVQPGGVTVRIRSSTGTQETPLSIAPVAPGLFTVNADGLAAAFILRVAADGTQTVEPVATTDDAGRIVALPIDFGPATDRLFLQLYGTGIRGRLRLQDVSVTISAVGGGINYAGAQGQFPGLDQVNVLLSRQLVGRGDVEVTLRVEDQLSNVVRLRVR